MNADQLLAHYDKIADTPDAIACLRRFVLDLAVRGKLVEQDPTDEPTSALLKRIAVARENTPTSGRRTSKKRVDPSLAELPFTLPDGWSKAKLSELVRVVNGRAYKKSELLETGTPVLRVGNLFTSDHWYYSNLELENDKYCDKGDLIYAWSASFGPFIWDGPRVIYHYHIWKLPFFSEADLDKHFLYLFLQQKTREIKDAGHGISMVHMTKEKMEQLAVPLPPLAEQHRIVAKVDELMALLNRLEATRTAREATRDRLTTSSLASLTAPDADAQVFPAHARFALDALPALTARPDQINQLRQTILNLAVRGKLVEQDPTDEPASQLLERITAEKTRLVKAGEIRKQKTLVRILDDEHWFSVPSGWAWGRLVEIGHTQTGTSPSSSKPELFGDFIPFVKPADLDGASIHCDGPGLSLEGKDHSRVAPQNTVMMVCIGATLGKVNITEQEVCFNQQINSVTPFIDGMHRFVALALKSSDFQGRAWGRAGTGTLPIISKGKWEVLPIPLPPLAEQHRIVAKVDELMALCDRLEATLATTDTTRRRLLEALLYEALTPAADERAAAE